METISRRYNYHKGDHNIEGSDEDVPPILNENEVQYNEKI
jgi:hypothetical protein